MLVHQVAKLTGLTKKAIAYYEEQGLVVPAVLQNGYRDFDEKDVERLIQIAVLRRLELGIADIKAALTDETGDVLQRVAARKELEAQRNQMQKAILNRLCREWDYAAIGEELQALAEAATLTERLLEAFPGYYGRWLSLHFARFLNEPAITCEQKAAYQEMLDFLDDAPPPEIPEDLRESFEEMTKAMNVEDILRAQKMMGDSFQNPERFLRENQEIIESQLTLRQSEEYKNSATQRIQAFWKEWNQTTGYYDRFIPAMKKASASYGEYCRQMERASQMLLEKYPTAGEGDA